MDNNQRKAKIQTYMIQLQNGNIQGNQMEVLDYIWRHSGTTIHKMRTELFMAHQSLTPSVSNLMDAGIVKEIGQIKINDSIYSQFQFVPDAEEQDRLAEDRLMDKFKQWKQKGRDFIDLMDDELRDILGYTGKFTSI